MERKIAKSAVRAGATVIAKQAKANAPIGDTGVLKRSIQVVARSSRMADAGVSVVTRSGKKYNARKMNAWYASMVEFGTKFIPAQSFMRTALDTKANEAIDKIKQVLRKRIDQVNNGH